MQACESQSDTKDVIEQKQMQTNEAAVSLDRFEQQSYGEDGTGCNDSSKDREEPETIEGGIDGEDLEEEQEMDDGGELGETVVRSNCSIDCERS